MDELKRIRLKKIKELEARIQKKEKMVEEAKEFDLEKKRLMSKILDKEAFEYLIQLHKIKPNIANIIEDLLIKVVSLGRLNEIINRVDIMALERKIEGKGPEIKVKRKGKEVVDLSTELKKED